MSALADNGSVVDGIEGSSSTARPNVAVEVLVRFVTKYNKFKVTEESIAIPSRLKRYGLSDVVNHLLQLPKPVPFDFVLNNSLLRGSLARSILAQHLNTEEVLELEYMPALLSPQVDSRFQSPDWVAALDAGVEGYVYAGTYDGSISLFSSETGKQLLSFRGHTSGVKGISVARNQSSPDGLTVATGSQDHTVRTWCGSVGVSNPSIEPLGVGRGHSAEVSSVAIGPTRNVVASASWDRSVRLWRIPEGSTPSVPSTKKRKTGLASVSELKDMESLYAMDLCHTDATTCLSWASSRSFFSGGLDRRIHSWDAETGQLNGTINTSHAVSSISYSPESLLLASAHPDNTVRVWDPRVKSESTTAGTFKGHKKYVTSVCWAPYNENLLASVSHDLTLKIWDKRASIALHTVERVHEQKILTLDWQMKDTIVSGGADCNIAVSKISLI
jgi:ribosome biogenesis protein